ncbi:hypothetical protein GCM10011608_61140 [Micromonospora sonchi]|uniref:Uncharacterized protein n=1 Tax=Micromonospora sonchi TaxID=1763543 RepID=A0A917X583_9ACTN|nr:DUF5988 family protein [Micromonospora sonchi]GGM67704.1 hypothetical protein GCM10011608_61140 [Micromonospora sonchi]
MAIDDHDSEMRGEDAILIGGPSGLPESRRLCQVPDGTTKVKVGYLGGHEHFERTEERLSSTAGLARVYRWSMRTKVAE